MANRFKLTEQNYRYLFNNASDAMWVHDMGGRILVANRASEKLTGYTGAELDLYRDQLPSLAARFAGKEAVIKVLGKPGGSAPGWKDIEILSDSSGRPVVNLYGKAREQATNLGLRGVAVSLSHSREYAVAFVVGETK